jgi:hypothetical protein
MTIKFFIPLLLLLSIYQNSCAQRCGGGVFTIYLDNPENEDITVTVYPLEGAYYNEFKSQYCSGGCELTEEIAKKWRLIQHTQRSKTDYFFPLYEETKIRKNKVDFNTLELAFEPRVLLFECEKTNKRVLIAANIHGGCDHHRTIKWNVEKPFLAPYGQ